MPVRHPQAGEVIGGFRLEELLHIGGMSHLWRVTGPAADGPLLMKILMLRPGEKFGDDRRVATTMWITSCSPARGSSTLRRYLGGTSSELVAKARPAP
jgi:hypothetical protein